MSATFQHHVLVRQEHLNQYGNLFGGRVLAVVDELAFIACSRTFPGNNFVTRALRQAEFTAPAVLGDMLEYSFAVETVGRTSVTVRVTVDVRNGRTSEMARSFDGEVVMVCVDEKGCPTPVEAAP